MSNNPDCCQDHGLLALCKLTAGHLWGSNTHTTHWTWKNQTAWVTKNHILDTPEIKVKPNTTAFYESKVSIELVLMTFCHTHSFLSYSVLIREPSSFIRQEQMQRHTVRHYTGRDIPWTHSTQWGVSIKSLLSELRGPLRRGDWNSIESKEMGTAGPQGTLNQLSKADADSLWQKKQAQGQYTSTTGHSHIQYSFQFHIFMGILRCVWFEWVFNFCVCPWSSLHIGFLGLISMWWHSFFIIILII